MTPTDVEYTIASAIDPLPFKRLLPGPKPEEDRSRRRWAILKAQRVIRALAAVGVCVDRDELRREVEEFLK